MNDWWKDGVPAFVVVGRVNAGKSSTLATLLEVDDDCRAIHRCLCIVRRSQIHLLEASARIIIHA